MRQWLRAVFDRQVKFVTRTPPDPDVELQSIWILNEGPNDDKGQQCLTWWRNQDREHRDKCSIVAIAGHSGSRMNVGNIELIFDRQPDEFYESWHRLCRYCPTAKQINPCRTHIKIVTNLCVENSDCIGEPRSMHYVMANLAKECFSSSLSSTSFASRPTPATDSLAETGISREDPQNPRSSGYALSGRSGTPPFAKGIPDSNSDMITKPALVTQPNPILCS